MITSHRVFPNPTTYKYIDVSSSHVTKEDMDLLQGSMGIIAFPYEEGAFVHVPTEHGVFEGYHNEATDHYSREFCDLLEWAHERKCAFLRIDSDGETYEDMPTFDW